MSTDNPGEFGEIVRQRRIIRGFTQVDLCARAGISRASLIRWENGKTGLYEPHLVRPVCNVLGIDLREAVIALGYITSDEILVRRGMVIPDKRIGMVRRDLQNLLKKLEDQPSSAESMLKAHVIECWNTGSGNIVWECSCGWSGVFGPGVDPVKLATAHVPKGAMVTTKVRNPTSFFGNEEDKEKKQDEGS